jgi:polyisoprenoid-binding protein YceI
MTDDAARTRPLLMAGVAVASIVVIVSGLLLWRAFSGDEPAEVALGSLSPAVNEEAGASPSATTDGGATSPDTFDGTWAIDTETGSLDDASASFAGYRIEEELGGIGANIAVGRTRNVQGSMTIAGTSATDLTVTVDMTSLQSDDERRDGQLASRGLETSRFPTATFTLVEPISVPSVPAPGDSVSATAVGDLTLHGVTQRVEVPVDAQWTGEHIEVAASLEIALADYDIEPPTGFLVLSIADTGTLELHLLFRNG